LTAALLGLAAVACRPVETADESAGTPADEPAGTATGGVPAGGNPQRCVDDFDPDRDYFPVHATFDHAEQVAVEYFRHYKVLTVRRPWAGAEEPVRYLLLLCGTPRPPGFDGVPTIEIPARTVITTSTTELPHLVRLGVVERLVGHDEFDYVTSPEVRRRFESGAVLEVGSGPRLNVELVVAADPDLLMIDHLDESGLGVLAKLREAAVPVVLTPSFLETSPLGRAEWIEVTALFFDRERRASKLFAEVAERYLELRGKVARAVEAGAERPTVLASGPIGDHWWVPGGRSYLARLLADAGARYLWADEDTTGSVPLDLESVFERAADADFWIQPGGFASLAELRAADERLAALEAFRERRVYNYDARVNEHGGNDYWETGTARPDLVLADLVEIFHPDLLDHRLVFHRRLPLRSDDGGS
jgi:iron complex transport system substrate-binding protein